MAVGFIYFGMTGRARSAAPADSMLTGI
jgi:ethanolamine permease